MGKPILSVVIPCHNAAGTLASLLEGISKQDLPKRDFEVIIVDDCSSDNTAEIVAQFPFAIRIRLEKNSGPGFARNAGMAKGNGEIVLFLDADLEVATDLFRKHVEFHHRNPEIAAAGGSVCAANGGILSWATADHLSTWFNAHPKVQYAQLPEYLPSLNFSVKRDLVLETFKMTWSDGLKHTGEDVIYCHSLRSKGGKIAFVNDARVFHRDREELSAFLKHQYRFGFHAPFVRGSLANLKYGFLFTKNPAMFVFTVPSIVFGYTALTWVSWLRVHPVLVSVALPQIFLGKMAYAWGVVKGTFAFNQRKSVA